MEQTQLLLARLSGFARNILLSVVAPGAVVVALLTGRFARSTGESVVRWAADARPSTAIAALLVAFCVVAPIGYFLRAVAFALSDRVLRGGSTRGNSDRDNFVIAKGTVRQMLLDRGVTDAQISLLVPSGLPGLEEVGAIKRRVMIQGHPADVLEHEVNFHLAWAAVFALSSALFVHPGIVPSFVAAGVALVVAVVNFVRGTRLRTQEARVVAEHVDALLRAGLLELRP